MIYFDNSATTLIYPQVLDTYVKTSQRIIGNPSSLYDLGIQSSRLINQSRKQIADLIQVEAEEIFFTSGGTEGNNWVLKGTAFEKKKYGNHIIISAIEHPSVMETVKQLEGVGFDISVVPVDKRGFINLSELEKLICPATILVSVMAVNNEIGSIQPIKELANCLIKYPKIHFHVDAVQAIGKIAIRSWLPSRVDFATFSAHKFHGPKGIGFAYCKKGRKLLPLLSGGGQEENQRSGTENVAGIVAMSKALRLYLDESQLHLNRVYKISQYLKGSLSEYPKILLFSEDTNDFISNILCFGIEGIRGEILVHALEEKQIYISTTSACSSKKKMNSGTLKAMNISENMASTAVRASFDFSNTMYEAEQFMVIMNQLYTRFGFFK